jgi:flagellar basal-body rod protein FlgB
MLNGLNEYIAAPMQAIALRAQRGEVLASNIANADTPGYKARDFDFATALREAVGRGSRLELVRTSSGHVASAGAKAGNAALQYRLPVQPSIDGNTVELDTELAQFSDNALHYQASLTFLTSKFQTLRTAITGQ